MPPTECAIIEDQFNALRPAAIPDLVRIGRDHDGGYIVSKRSLTAANVLLAFGINDDVSFEADACALVPNLETFCFDPTTNFRRIAIRSLKSATLSLLNLCAGDIAGHRKRLAFARRYFELTRFFRASNHHLQAKWIGTRNTIDAVDIATLFDELETRRRDRHVFVKMDVEGSEYACLPRMAHYLISCTGFAIEFHTLGDKWNSFIEIIDLLKERFYIAHIHGNNFGSCIKGTCVPDVLEVSFVSKSLFSEPLNSSRHGYPIPEIDMPNWDAKPDLKLPFNASG